MKTILYVLLLILSISCDKEKVIEKITINGIVSDMNNNLLDNVKIILEESTCFMCIGPLPIETNYSKDGIFKFEFTPRIEKSYHLSFEKKGYLKRTYYADLNKESQDCNIIMERVTE